MEAVIEKECSALGGLFQTVIADMKSSYPIWEDFITKAGKLQSQLRATGVAVAAFLDAFQKVADLATNSRGGTRDIGSALTRMCLRHRSIEVKLKQFSMGFLEGLINPLQEQIEEWKRGVNTLDKDHAKEYKRARQEIKKKSSDTLKLQKKAKKGRGDIQPQLDSAMQDVSDKYILLEETEKQALRKALIEERLRFCCFVTMLQPVVDEEISLLGEVTHLQAISDDLKALTSDPHKLPPASEQVILDLKNSDYGWSYQTPPSSPSTTISRKSSMCSSLNSVNSSDSRGSSGSHSHSPSSSSSSSSSHHLFHHHHPRHRYRSSTLPQQTPARLSSISSHDSGFVSSSHDQYTSLKSSSPMPAETKLANGFDHYSPASSPYLHSNGGSSGSVSSTAFPFLPTSSTSSTTSCPSHSWSRPASALLPDYPHYCTVGSPMVPSSRVPSWKDWAKPGPYDQPMVNTLRRKKDKETPASATVEEKSMTVASPLKAHEELALALSRGLELDTQRSSRDSIQCSSGYSTQTNTPCCSEDTIPSQVSDYDYFSMAGDQEPEQQSDFDKSSTIPRNSDISQSYRRMFQTKRPASTAGLPRHGPVIVTPGVATIRRTPSSKPSARRLGSIVGTGPIPIRTPVIPVKIPTVPDVSGTFNGSRNAEDIGGGGGGGGEEESPDSPTFTGVEDAGTLPVMSWSGQATTNPPTIPLTQQHLQSDTGLEGGEEAGEGGDGNMLVAIRKGVKLKRTLTNDRSAPRIA
uniref:Protein MTSS 1-like n=1 Tax=Echeneis naucrates TaxID=173247 RepID=A0A665T6A9_ECHNA